MACGWLAKCVCCVILDAQLVKSWKNRVHAWHMCCFNNNCSLLLFLFSSISIRNSAEPIPWASDHVYIAAIWAINDPARSSAIRKCSLLISNIVILIKKIYLWKHLFEINEHRVNWEHCTVKNCIYALNSEQNCFFLQLTNEKRSIDISI